MTQYYESPQLSFSGIVREDGAWIPNDPANRDWAEYQAWLAAGNKPLPWPDGGVPVETKEV